MLNMVYYDMDRISKISNEELLKEYKETNNEKILIDIYYKNKPILFLVLKEHPSLRPWFNKEMNPDVDEELEYIYDIALTNTLRLFDESKGYKFLTLLTKAVKREMVHSIDRRNTKSNLFNYESLKFSINDTADKKETKVKRDCESTINRTMDKELQEDKYFYNEIKNVIKKKVKNERTRYICYRILEGVQQTDIAKELNTSRQYVQQTLRRLGNISDIYDILTYNR